MSFVARTLVLVAVLGVSVVEAPAQNRPPPRAAPAEPAPAPEPPPPPYEPQLLQLAEIVGSLAYLRTLCAADDAAQWRDRMAALLEAEGRTPARHARLTAAYNRGFRAYATTHRQCAAGSREAAARLAVDGERLARVLAGRFGG